MFGESHLGNDFGAFRVVRAVACLEAVEAGGMGADDVGVGAALADVTVGFVFILWFGLPATAAPG